MPLITHLAHSTPFGSRLFLVWHEPCTWSWHWLEQLGSEAPKPETTDVLHTQGDCCNILSQWNQGVKGRLFMTLKRNFISTITKLYGPDDKHWPTEVTSKYNYFTVPAKMDENVLLTLVQSWTHSLYCLMWRWQAALLEYKLSYLWRLCTTIILIDKRWWLISHGETHSWIIMAALKSLCKGYAGIEPSKTIPAVKALIAAT